MNINNENIRRDALHRVSATDSISDQPRRDAIYGVSTTAISAVKRGLLQGMGIALGFFGTTVFAVAVTGTIKTWTSGEVLKSADLNTTIASMKTAIEGIPNWSKSGTADAIYTGGIVGIATSPKSPASLTLGASNGVALALIANSTIAGTTLGGNLESFLYPRFNDASYLDYGTNGFFIRNNSSVTTMFMNSSNQVGIGTTSPSQLLTVNGNAGNTTGVWVNNSDERLKKNIQPLGNYLDKLTELRPVTFEWKEPKKLNAKAGKHIGFIAQEVEKVFPYWVDTDKEGMKWLSPEGINAAFVQSIKELKSLYDHEKSENMKLKERISRLELERSKLLSLEDRIKAIETTQMSYAKK